MTNTNTSNAGRVGQSCEALFVIELIDKHGNAAAADMLGISPSTASEAKKNGLTRITTERLAEQLVAAEEREAMETASVMVVKVPVEQLDAFNTVCKAMRLKSAEIPD